MDVLIACSSSGVTTDAMFMVLLSAEVVRDVLQPVVKVCPVVSSVGSVATATEQLFCVLFGAAVVVVMSFNV